MLMPACVAQYYRAKILKYLRQVAVITPYLRFTFKYTGASDEKGNIDLTFRRRADKMPEPPKACRRQPSSHAVHMHRLPLLIRGNDA
jgi:DNA topoisomerase VI subunit B